ncbi:MAG: ATP-binding cassette domain-containing protein, partial [Variovorax sp.]
TQGVVDGRMTLGDLVMVNAFMIQLYIPLNFLGVIYREIKQSLTDLDKMFVLLEKEREVRDAPEARPLAGHDSTVRFEDVSFAYEAARPILKHVSFEIPAGKTVAVVGPSGSGKSTLARLLYRFYDVQQGRITIGAEDIRQVMQASVRQAIGIVPQDTVLFNDTVEYNIAYGRPGAGRAEVEDAARAARNKTTLVIAHRLSTVVDAHEILVLESGVIVERGTHAQLLEGQGKYAQMWRLQKLEAEPVL